MFTRMPRISAHATVRMVTAPKLTVIPPTPVIKITEAVKEEYLAGSDGDRERLEKKLLVLEDAEGSPLYEEKNFTQWVSAADKKAEKAKDEKNWWDEVK